MPSTSSRNAVLSVVLGCQEPRVCHVPAYVSSTGDEAIALAALAGLMLDDWQQFVLRHSLGERPDGKWAAKTIGLVVGRQNGKGSILEARELAGLFLLDEQLIIHTAHQQKTATSHFSRLRNLIKRVPEFEEQVKSAPTGKGSEAIHLHSGQSIFFSTREGGGGRGLTADVIVYDEAMYLSEQDRSSLSPTMAARSIEGNVQTWMTGSAVDQQDPRHDGMPFAQVREAGLSRSPGVAFFEWSLEGDDPEKVTAAQAADIESVRKANPSLGKRISFEWVEHERTVDLSRRGFAVERLGVGDWPDTSEDAGRVIPRHIWDALAETNPENRITGRPIFAFDVNPTQTWASIAVAGKRADGLFNVAIDSHDTDAEWLVERCIELRKEHRGCRFVVLKRSTAAAYTEDLLKAKCRVIEAPYTEYGIACAAFYAGVMEGKLRWPQIETAAVLDDALATARKAPLSDDGWRWSKKQSTGGDISPIVAVTLAYFFASRVKSPPKLINLGSVGHEVIYASSPSPVSALETAIASENAT